MAKKRTKQAKIKAQQLRKSSVEPGPTAAPDQKPTSKTQSPEPALNLLSYDVRLIKKDLGKTLLVTLLVVVLLVALTWYL